MSMTFRILFIDIVVPIIGIPFFSTFALPFFYSFFLDTLALQFLLLEFFFSISYSGSPVYCTCRFFLITEISDFLKTIL